MSSPTSPQPNMPPMAFPTNRQEKRHDIASRAGRSNASDPMSSALRMRVQTRREGVHLLRQVVDSHLVDLFMQAHDLQLGAQVDFVVELFGQPVFRRLAVLAHHDYDRLERRGHRQHHYRKSGGWDKSVSSVSISVVAE